MTYGPLTGLVLRLLRAQPRLAGPAREGMAHGKALLKEITEPGRRALGPPAQEAKWAVAWPR
ncbi:hypothetical protein J4032_10715 [Streptomyces formicae]|uniref:Uncharacterized protein n=1 Tax=Streptomyces formicae TaxID=1616117 RepID=A0ABY3WQ62_9ACTN|nr:hypothetical protein [Streptomyces formicae]UNM11948.1 hypothetical protein J4032_10715 [Streptomyces formicae]